LERLIQPQCGGTTNREPGVLKKTKTTLTQAFTLVNVISTLDANNRLTCAELEWRRKRTVPGALACKTAREQYNSAFSNEEEGLVFLINSARAEGEMNGVLPTLPIGLRRSW